MECAQQARLEDSEERRKSLEARLREANEVEKQEQGRQRSEVKSSQLSDGAGPSREADLDVSKGSEVRSQPAG